MDLARRILRHKSDRNTVHGALMCETVNAIGGQRHSII